MNWIGNGIAFAALCACATVLELNNHEAGGLWAMVIIWLIIGDFHPREPK